MGRPLKIAKAQAVITITATADATDLVTTSANFTNLGIIAGMPFVTTANIGGLIAGTFYWILKVVNSDNNSTFTVSETPLNANPTQAPKNLSTASGTVSTTVAPVDTYFNNPNGTANTYSVVGGNTAIVGNQVLCNVAIGQNGVGTVFASTSSNVVVGLGTDFANVPTGTTLFALWGSDPTDPSAPHVLGTTTATKGNLLVGLANCAANGVIGVDIGSNAQSLTVGTPVVFDTSFGGNITAGTTYFVENIANSSAFTVSTSPTGSALALSANASVTGNAIQNRIVLSATSSNNASGVTGYGDPFNYATREAGYIVRQKGKQKYLVKGTSTGLIGQCLTANVANSALMPNTMTITATYANSATVNVQSLSDHTAELFTANSGPVASGNIVLEDADPAFVTFNSAAAPNVANAQPYPIVTINNA